MPINKQDFSVESFLHEALQKRVQQGLFRSLSQQSGLVDFCSNDYLGFARSEELKQLIDNDVSPSAIGSTGSRLISGNSSYVEELEKSIANYHRAEAGLIYNSGYDANVGLFSCIARRTDTIIYDELIHASVRDGLRISLAKSLSFRHNDLNHLEDLLKKAQGTVFIVVESVYSMDGDFAHLNEIIKLCNTHAAHLIVDEAHATGVFGKKGEGRVNELQLEDQVFARIYTFGKALGCHGAIILGSKTLRDYLINFSRSFIYTTALPYHALKCIKHAYELLPKQTNKQVIVNNLIKSFKSKIKSITDGELIESHSPIQCLVYSGNDRVKKLATAIQKEGFDVRPILSPTVPKGKERLRICLHSFNTSHELDGLLNSISSNTFVKTNKL